MDPNEERGKGREALSTRLRQLADMIDSGSVKIGEQTATVPEDFDYELELDEDPNKMEIEIEMKWKQSM